MTDESRSGAPWPSTRRIRVGGVRKAELRRQLASAGVQLNPLADQLLDGAGFATRELPRSMELVFVTVGQLGFERGARFEDIVAEAMRRGLSVCPLETAVHLRLQFTDQAEGAVGHPPTRHRAPPGSVTVVSPEPGDEEAPWGLYLRRIDGVLWLRGYRSWRGHPWSAEDVLAFASS